MLNVNKKFFLYACILFATYSAFCYRQKQKAEAHLNFYFSSEALKLNALKIANEEIYWNVFYSAWIENQYLKRAFYINNDFRHNYKIEIGLAHDFYLYDYNIHSDAPINSILFFYQPSNTKNLKFIEYPTQDLDSLDEPTLLAQTQDYIFYIPQISTPIYTSNKEEENQREELINWLRSDSLKLEDEFCLKNNYIDKQWIGWVKKYTRPNETTCFKLYELMNKEIKKKAVQNVCSHYAPLLEEIQKNLPNHNVMWLYTQACKCSDFSEYVGKPFFWNKTEFDSLNEHYFPK